ncbi:MAG TPA: FAD-binding oxidoreductase [Gemmatimonadaceae bacterium]|nr:FAD-binding oxidoreductase [Gemmatimonadaceae bacterium]
MELSRDLDVRRAYARDVSGLELVPDAVARPNAGEDVIDLVRAAIADRTPITAAGSQTSTTGASITDAGVLLSMRAMSRIIDVDTVERIARVQPAVTVGALNAELAPLGLRFAPDPTSEHDATIGGAIACNASGARSLRYGPTRAHVRAVRVVNGEGNLMELRRPGLEKNTVGYYAAQDPVDWIVGSEGTLGIIVEAELSLVALPEHELGLAVPFPDEASALRFIVHAREHADGDSLTRPQCLELFDAGSLAIARADVGSPRWMNGAAALVYLEQALDADELVAESLDRWLASAQAFDARADDIEVFEDAAALRAARKFRHAVPAYMNERGAQRRPFGGRKVSTDWAVPYRRLAEALEAAHRAADGQKIEPPITYGHAGNGHPHQNFIAADAEELWRINGVIDETIRAVLRLGGTAAAEHGLGKLKRPWLRAQLTPAQIELMLGLKRALDPLGLFAPGNVL